MILARTLIRALKISLIVIIYKYIYVCIRIVVRRRREGEGERGEERATSANKVYTEDSVYPTTPM